MELKLEVYTPTLELVGMIEIQRSIIWEEYAFKAGSFSLDSLITPDVTALLVPDNIIWITGDTAGIIESIQEKADENGPYITVKGPLLTGILSRRILWGRYQMSGTPAAIMYQLVEDCAINPTRGDDVEARKIPGLTLSDVPLGGTAIRKQQTGGTLLEALEEIGEAYQTAFGVRFDPAVPRMVFWARQGVDRTIKQNVNEPVFYSTELEDVLSSEYTYNSQEYRNIALVAGEDEGENRVHVVVGGSGGNTPQPPTPPEPGQYTVSVGVDPSGSGTATGAGQYEKGAQATTTATPGTGYRFVKWQENGIEVSKNAKYTFTVNSNRNLTAIFETTTPSRLPAGYIEVEYIKSDSNCGINTGVKLNLVSDKLEIDLMPDLYVSGDEYVLGSSSASRPLCRIYRDSAATITRHWGKASRPTSTNLNITEKRIAISISNGVLRVGTTTLENVTNSMTTAGTVYLFTDTNAAVSIQARLYSCKIYKSGALSRNFIPCVNPSGIVGLYDLENNAFYQNIKNGTFTAGSAV